MVAAALLVSAALPARAQKPAQAPQAGGTRLTDVRTGIVVAREGQRLRLVTDIGNVRILTEGTSPNQVSYSVRIETDGRQPEARALLQQFKVVDGATAEGVQIRGIGPWKKEFRGRLWVTMEVRIPRQYDLEVETGAGNVDTQEIRGRAVLVSLGGNITAGRIHGSAKIKTAGGHIKLKDVDGDLAAVTGGGHVEVGEVGGVAILQSAGGHVKAVSVQKWAELRTAGGNVSLNRTGGKAVVESGGGQISLGDVAGAVQAKTGGGAIQIRRVIGPMNIETAGGSIVLEQVLSPVRANTGSGQITAWFSAAGQKEIVEGSELVCGQGDILVYLPRELAVRIEATIEAAGEHRILFDPKQLDMKTSYVRSPGGPRVLRGEAVLNGGSRVLRLHTVAGNIKLLFAEERKEAPPAEQGNPPGSQAQAGPKIADRLYYWGRGSLPVNAEVLNARLSHKVQPRYPEAAVKGAIEGWVWIAVVVNEEGAVEEMKVVSGHPWLADAAAEAVKQWRYHPTLLDGRPVKVSSVVKVVFMLKQ